MRRKVEDEYLGSGEFWVLFSGGLREKARKF